MNDRQRRYGVYIIFTLKKKMKWRKIFEDNIQDKFSKNNNT